MNHSTFNSIANASGRALGAVLALGVLLSAAGAHADDHSGWSLNFTPVLVLPEDDYRLGGGVDPEMKYTLDMGGARLSAGARVGGYYVKNLFGLMAMPTLRITVPVGPFEPYASFGMGYGAIPKLEHADVATMSRIGFVIRFSESVALGLEGTLQRIAGSKFSFPSFGSMMAFEF